MVYSQLTITLAVSDGTIVRVITGAFCRWMLRLLLINIATESTHLCWTCRGRWFARCPWYTARTLHCGDPPAESSLLHTLSGTRQHHHHRNHHIRSPMIELNWIKHCKVAQFKTYSGAAIIDPKLPVTTALSQRILGFVAEVHRWRRGHGGVVRVRVAAHLESSRTPSIINTTHPVMGDSVYVDNFSFCTSLLYMGSIFKTHPEKGENKKWDIILVFLSEICECHTLQECSHGLSSLVLHTHSLQ